MVGRGGIYCCGGNEVEAVRGGFGCVLFILFLF